MVDNRAAGVPHTDNADHMAAAVVEIAGMEPAPIAATPMDTLLQLCAAQPDDSMLQLLHKQQKLLLLRQACQAWLNRSSSGGTLVASGLEQAAQAPSIQPLPVPPQPCQHHQRQHQHEQENTELQQVSLSPARKAGVVLERLARKQQTVCALQPDLQKQEQRQGQQQQQPSKPSSTKDVFAALFGPLAAAFAAPGAAAAATSMPAGKRREPDGTLPLLVADQQETHNNAGRHTSSTVLRTKVEAKEQPPQPLQERNEEHCHVFSKQEQQHQRHMQWQQPGVQQQQQPFKQPQPQGRRRRHQKQPLPKQQNHTQQQPQQQQGNQPQEQQQGAWLQRQRQQHLDAQSQAPCPTVQQFRLPDARATAALRTATALQQRESDELANLQCKQTTWLPPALAGQQLFSPRTATHAPRISQGSYTQGEGWQPWQEHEHEWQQDELWKQEQHGSKQQQQQHDPSWKADWQDERLMPSQLPQMHCRETVADDHMGEACLADAVVTPAEPLLDASGGLGTQQQLEVASTPQQQQHQQQQDIPDVVAATPLPDCQGDVSTPASKLVTCSVVAESPAAPVLASAADREGVGATFSFPAVEGREHGSLALFQAAPAPQPAAVLPPGHIAPAVACENRQLVSAAAEDTAKRCMAQQQQQQQWQSHCDNRLFLGLRQQQHRTQSVHLGQPVAGILSCQQQCVVMLQHGSSSNRFDLLQLQVQPSFSTRQGQRQLAPQGAADGISISFESRATLITPTAATASCAAAAVKVLPQPYLVDMNCGSKLQNCQQQCLGWEQRARAGVLLAVAVPFEIQALSISGQPVPAIDAPLPAAAASTSALDRRAHSESPAAPCIFSSTPGRGAATAGRSLKALSHSTSRNKALASAQGARSAGAMTVTAGGAQNHGVYLYRMEAGVDCSSTGGTAAAQPMHGQQKEQAPVRQLGVVLVQRLPTSHAVTCLAVSEQVQCFAAAGAAGFACVWPLLPQHHMQQEQQQQQHDRCTDAPAARSSKKCTQQQDGSGAVAAAAGAILLPAASYRGISFPGISELCFILQPASGCSSVSNQVKEQQQQRSSSYQDSHVLHNPGIRVLLVGCSSQGSLAVWDVKLKQQVMAVHSPDLQLFGLLPVQPPLPASYKHEQQQQATQPLLLLALVASRDRTTPPALTKASSRLGNNLGLRTASMVGCGAQEQQLELRPVLLQQPGLLLPGKPILPGHAAAGKVASGLAYEQLHQGRSVAAAALAGTVAAAVDADGLVRVWDLVSGSTLMCARSPTCATGKAAAVQVVTLQDIQQHSCHAEESGGVLVMIGARDGTLNFALL